MTQSEHPEPIPDQVLTPLSAEQLKRKRHDAWREAHYSVYRDDNTAIVHRLYDEAEALDREYESAIRAPLEARLAEAHAVVRLLQDMPYEPTNGDLSGEAEHVAYSAWNDRYRAMDEVITRVSAAAALAGVPKEAGNA